ncbi:MAG: hypothetical protein WBZ51_29125, partial [Xanthobacteraceae bacterium]
ILLRQCELRRIISLPVVVEPVGRRKRQLMTWYNSSSNSPPARPRETQTVLLLRDFALLVTGFMYKRASFRSVGKARRGLLRRALFLAR